MREATLRVAFDGRALVSSAGGVRRYVRELVAAIAAGEPDVALVAIGAPASVPLPAGVVAAPVPFGLPTNLGWTMVALPLALRRTRPDVYHAPAYTAPPWGAPPMVVTIHDVSYARRPEWYPYRLDAIRRAFYRRSALAADVVITDSGFSRGEIAAAYGIDAARIAVVPLGVGAPFGPGAGPAAPPLPEGGASPFVLHAGDLHPRRNVVTALCAVLAARRRAPALASLRLVLAGADRGSGRGVLDEARAAGQPDAVVLLGAVDEATLVALYRTAAVFIYPSRYEGFGLPVLEAMACGAPVVASRAGAVPEVAGDAALLVDPDDVGGFADAVAGIVQSAELAGRLRAASLARAARFTWQRTAAETAQVYRRCAAAARRI